MDLLNAVSSHSISALRPDIPRVHSAPELNSSGVSLCADSALNYGRVHAQLLAKSPSLGYIPSAFPLEIFQGVDDPMSHSLSSTSVSASDVGAVRPPQVGDVLPAIPTLSLSLEEVNYGGSAIPSILDFIQDAHLISKDSVTDRNGVPSTILSRLPPSSSTLSSSNSSFGFHPASFAPSTQSHSTSIMAHGDPDLRPQLPIYRRMPLLPLPVAFKMRLSDLSALSKRINTLSSEDLTSVASSTDTEGLCCVSSCNLDAIC